VRILFLSRWYPIPADNGSKLRVFNLLRGLAVRHEVTLLAFADEPEIDLTAPELRSVCQEVKIVRWKPYDPSSLRARLSFLSMIPRSVAYTYSPAMQRQIERSIATGQYDLVIASQWMMAVYGKYFRETPALLEEVELGLFNDQYTRALSTRGRIRNRLTWAKYQHYLSQAIENYQACTVVSEEERQLLAPIVPDEKPIEVIPNCINLADYQSTNGASRAKTLIFTGSFRYHANHGAMVWFLNEVYPRIEAEVPDIHLTITGDHANKPLPRTDNVTLTGYVEDIQALIASSSVSIVPIQVGGGTRLKILEAMALRTPVVSTSKGVEGIAVRNGEDILIGDSPQEFANAVVRLLNEPDLRGNLAENAHELVAEHYNWPKVMPRFLNLVENLANRGMPVNRL